MQVFLLQIKISILNNSCKWGKAVQIKYKLLDRLERAFEIGDESQIAAVSEELVSAGMEPQLHLSFLRFYLETLNLDAALNYIETHELEESAPIQINIGIVYMLLEHPEIAITHFEKAIELDRKNLLALDFCKLAKFASGEHSTLLEFKFKYLHGNIYFEALLYLYLSDFYSKNFLELPSEEEESGEESSSELKFPFFDSMTSFIYMLCGRAFISMGRYELASKLFLRALKLDSSLRRLHFMAAESLYLSKKYLEAKRELELAVKEDGETPESLYYLARIEQLYKRYDSARELFQKMLERFEKSPEAYTSLGEISLAEGNFLSAFSYFKSAAEGDSLILEDLFKECVSKLKSIGDKA